MWKAIAIALVVAEMLVVVLGGDSIKATAQTPPPSTRGAAAPKDMTLELGSDLSLKLVQIPAGKFLMGSPETEKDRVQDEVQHEVTLSKPFYMGITHVTVGQFAGFATDSGYQTDAEKDGWSYGAGATKVAGCSWVNPTFDQTRDHPVVHVTWGDAQAFCD